ncbi:MAG: arylsulfatase [Chitinophagaceae bacterium]|nr:arylsulfatase [Chitinophagaceae bacterium]
MKALFIFLLLFNGICINGRAQVQQNNEKVNLPNIVFILADDLGYGDVGAYGQKLIETPNIDQLAKEGMIFTQHYSNPVCAPARYSLMTGKHAGRAYIRGNDEWSERGNVWDFKAMEANPFLEGQLPIPDSTITVAKLLQKAGYRTGMAGKWGLGGPFTTGIPNKQGFDYFYGFLCQRQDHNYYAGHLWENELRVPLNNIATDPNIHFPKDLDSLDPRNYEQYVQHDYSPDFIVKAALTFINKNKDHPFFLYYPSPLPHTSLQAPERWVDYYLKKFGTGEKPFLGGGYIPVRYPRAVRAAMVSLLDEQVGQIIHELKKNGLYQNTIIVFTGDNGATYEGGTDNEFFNTGGPFKSTYGWGKGSLHEGGIREPFIVSWPEKIKPGTRSDHLSAFWDFLPTVCEITGMTTPADIQGISFLPALLGQTEKQKHHEYLYWEFPGYGGQQAVRLGKWKGLIEKMHSGNTAMQLFDLDKDMQEQHDVSSTYPEVVKKLRGIMKKEHKTPEVRSFRIEVLEKP